LEEVRGIAPGLPLRKPLAAVDCVDRKAISEEKV